MDGEHAAKITGATIAVAFSIPIGAFILFRRHFRRHLYFSPWCIVRFRFIFYPALYSFLKSSLVCASPAGAAICTVIGSAAVFFSRVEHKRTLAIALSAAAGLFVNTSLRGNSSKEGPFSFS
jgi:uncharacterized membrane protein